MEVTSLVIIEKQVKRRGTNKLSNPGFQVNFLKPEPGAINNNCKASTSLLP